MKKKRPTYLWSCVVCKERMFSDDTTLTHCGKLTQWENGIDGKGVDMNSPMVKIHVSGYIEMSQENLDRILAYDDPHMGLVYSFHMGYTNTDKLEFTPEE